MTVRLILTFLLTSSACIMAQDGLAPTDALQIDLNETRANYVKQLANHHYDLMKMTEGAFNRQKWQTIAIAVMVHLMVAIGLWLSYLQFTRDKKDRSRSVTTLKLGSGSLEIKSPVIGLIILAMSFWFFQTYVSDVYTLKRMDIPAIDAAYFDSKSSSLELRFAE